MPVDLRSDLGDEAAIAAWACASGVISSRALVNGGVEIRSFRGRNDVFVIDEPPRRRVVKRFRDRRDAAAERRAYYRLARTPVAQHVLEIIAAHGRLVAYDSPAEMIGLGYRLYGGAPPTQRLARRMGMVLAALHGTPWPATTETPALPWILGIRDPAPPEILGEAPLLRELIGTVQGRSDVRTALQRPMDAPGPTVTCHNDVKWENWLVPAAGPAAGELRLIDLEHTGPGPAAWDVGSVLANFCELWIDSVARTPLPLQKQRALTAAFAAGYCAGDGTAHGARCAAFAGARLLQTAYESISFTARVQPGIRRRIDMAFHLLTRPEEAAVHFFGLDVRSFTPRG